MVELIMFHLTSELFKHFNRNPKQVRNYLRPTLLFSALDVFMAAFTVGKHF